MARGALRGVAVVLASPCSEEGFAGGSPLWEGLAVQEEDAAGAGLAELVGMWLDGGAGACEARGWLVALVNYIRRTK